MFSIVLFTFTQVHESRGGLPGLHCPSACVAFECCLLKTARNYDLYPV